MDSHRALTKYWLRLQSHLEAQVKEDILPSSLLRLLAGFSSSQVVGLGASFPHWLLARGFFSYLPHEPLHREVHIMAAGFYQSKQMREQEKVNRTEADSLCNIISEVTSHHFYYILFVRRKSLDSVNTQEERIIKGHGHHKQGSLEGIFETDYQSLSKGKRPSKHLKHVLYTPSLLRK